MFRSTVLYSRRWWQNTVTFITICEQSFVEYQPQMKCCLSLVCFLGGRSTVLWGLHPEMLVPPFGWGHMWGHKLQSRAAVCSEERFLGLSWPAWSLWTQWRSQSVHAWQTAADLGPSVILQSCVPLRWDKCAVVQRELLPWSLWWQACYSVSDPPAWIINCYSRWKSEGITPLMDLWQLTKSSFYYLFIVFLMVILTCSSHRWMEALCPSLICCHQGCPCPLA